MTFVAGALGVATVLVVVVVVVSAPLEEQPANITAIATTTKTAGRKAESGERKAHL
jgi:hypothetical protein